jgi:hypothetical protein
MNIIRDLLDKQVVDRLGNKVGKVDGVVMTLPSRGRPRVKAIEIGTLVLMRRLGVSAGVASRAAIALTGESQPPFRILWSKVSNVGKEIDVDIDINATEFHAWREWLRKNVISYMLGGRGEKQ